MSMIKMSLDEWEAEGKKRFGDDKLQWEFVCPICKTVIATKDWKEAGAPQGAVAYSCIGRYLPKEQSQRAFDESNKPAKKGVPCDYTNGGLLNLAPLAVTDIDGKEYYLFDFAKVKVSNE